MVDLLPQYPDGADLTLLNMYYQYGVKDPQTGKRLKDSLIVVYKDNETNEKKYEIIEEPEYEFYQANDDVILDHNLMFSEKEKVHPIKVKYKNIEKEIATRAEILDEYYNNIQERNSLENRKLHTLFNYFRSDITIEDYYRFIFSKRFKNDVKPVTKAYFDIEVDGRFAVGDFVEMGECPINAIAYYNQEKDEIHSFLLRDEKNKLIEDFENQIKAGKFTIKDIRKFMTTAIGGEKRLKYYRFDKTKINVSFYDNEIDLLKSFFGMVHFDKPDFILGYNSSGFDLEYIIQRIYVLGYEPADIMCDQSWPLKIVRHYIDKKNLSMFAERGDYTFISGHTVWIDQMIQFASRRKSKFGSFDSFKLDDIGMKIAKVHKLDYSHITNNLAMLPWLDFITFFLYNVFDVVVQKCIEQRNEDIEYIYAKCMINNTSYRRGHRQTVYLINRMTKEFDKLGFIIGNNVNRWNEKPEKFLGALVHDPVYTNDYAKMKINGRSIFVVNNLQDFDYKSLYPNIDLEHNIAPNTLIGRLIISEKVYKYENALNNPKYQRSGEFIENMVCQNYIVFCHRWFHLANFMEMLEDMQEYFTTVTPNFTTNGQYNTFQKIDGKVYINPMQPRVKGGIDPLEHRKTITPYVYFGKRPKVKRY